MIENRDEFFELLSELADECLSEAHVQRLAEILRDDAELRGIYAEFALLQSLIQRESRQRALIEREDFFPPVQATPAPLRAAPVPWGRRTIAYLSQPLHFGVFFATVACVSLLLFFAQIRIRTLPVKTPAAVAETAVETPPVAAVAQITRAVQCRWLAGAADKPVGATLFAGESLFLVQGVVELTFASDVKVLLAAPVRFRAITARRVALERGSLTARVPTPARGFEVETGAAVVTDLGTEFGVAVWDEETEVAVFSGSVVVASRLAADSRQKLVAGESVAIRAQARWSTVGEIKTPFVRELPTEVAEVWPRNLPLAHWKFEGQGQSVPNDALPDGRLKGVLGLTAESETLDPQRITGDRARVGAGALEFRGGQLVRVVHHALLNELGESFTLSAWFRTTAPLGALVYRKDDDSNPKIELVVQDSLMQFAVRDPFGAVATVAVPGQRVDDGRWRHVVAVKTSKKLQLYLDGSALAETPLPPDFGRLTFSSRPDLLLGAYFYLPGTHDGFLTGALDDVSIWPCALTAEEVQNLFQAAPDRDDSTTQETPSRPGELSTQHQT